MDFVSETWPLIMIPVYLLMLCVLPGSFVGYSFFYVPYLSSSLCFFGFGLMAVVAPRKMVGPGGGGEGIFAMIILVLSALNFLSAVLLQFKFKCNKKNIFAGAAGIVFTVIVFSLGAYLFERFGFRHSTGKIGV
jgi:hypothetical protein